MMKLNEKMNALLTSQTLTDQIKLYSLLHIVFVALWHLLIYIFGTSALLLLLYTSYWSIDSSASSISWVQ